MNTTKTPTALAMLKDGKEINFFDYNTGVKLPDTFTGIVRLYIGGTVDAIMRTELDKPSGWRTWFPVNNQSGSILPDICWLFATLLLAALFIVPTVRHYDGQVNDRLNQLISLERK